MRNPNGYGTLFKMPGRRRNPGAPELQQAALEALKYRSSPPTPAVMAAANVDPLYTQRIIGHTYYDFTAKSIRTQS
jgi:hypothetical protein